MTLWQVDIYPAEGQIDREAARTIEEIEQLGFGHVKLAYARSFLVQGRLDADAAQQLANQLLADSVTETPVVAIAGSDDLAESPMESLMTGEIALVNVLPKPGVMDPVAASTIAAAKDAGFDVEDVRTMRKYWIDSSRRRTRST